ncbi:uncharacterized protein LOC135214084 [Macrobrachium nipponense]|uniref:uncharacterized protein LOC135214084 n=1 Tax=Macrobrachium nipponense TaxID=159736 RepID=UPI0030C89FC3
MITPGKLQSSKDEAQARKFFQARGEEEEEEAETRPLSLCEVEAEVHAGETKEVGRGVDNATLYYYHFQNGSGLKSIHIKATFNKDTSDTKTLNVSDLCLDDRPTKKWHRISVGVFDRGDHKVLRISAADCAPAAPLEYQLRHKTSLNSYKGFRILAEGSSFWRYTPWPKGCPPFSPRTPEQRKVTVGLVVLLAVIIAVTNACLIVVAEKKRRSGELDPLCRCRQSGSQE